MVKEAMLNLYRINQDFDQRGIFLNLSGPLSHTLMVEMGGLMKTKMALEGSDAGTIKKAFSILVELNQNIIHYSAESEHDMKGMLPGCDNGCGIISVGRRQHNYFLLSGNLMENPRVEKLRKRLEQIQKMNKEELKEAYRIQRKNGPDDDSKGAGLGLLDIARNAAGSLEFNFDRVSASLTFFSLKITI